MEKSKFVVGDKVKIIKSSSPGNHYNHLIGEYGTIYNIYDGNILCDIVYDNDGLNDFKELDGTMTGHYKMDLDYLQHARIKATKIARKMNKNRIEKEEEGWLYLK